MVEAAGGEARRAGPAQRVCRWVSDLCRLPSGSQGSAVGMKGRRREQADPQNSPSDSSEVLLHGWSPSRRGRGLPHNLLLAGHYSCSDDGKEGKEELLGEPARRHVLSSSVPKGLRPWLAAQPARHWDSEHDPKCSAADTWGQGLCREGLRGGSPLVCPLREFRASLFEAPLPPALKKPCCRMWPTPPIRSCFSQSVAKVSEQTSVYQHQLLLGQN